MSKYRKSSKDIALLHPRMAAAVTATLEELAQRDIKMRIFEAYRYPERQDHLYAKGRTRMKHKKKVTKARGWQSMHQFGCAVDCVLDVKGISPWYTKGEHGDYRSWWRAYHEVGQSYGLIALSFEKPHLQLADFHWKDAVKRGDWPDGGSDPWVWNILESMERAPKRAPKYGPEFPDDEIECRPDTYDGLEA